MQNTNFESWKNDPRLKSMDPNRLAMLTAFAKELSEAPAEQKMPVFLSINQKAAAGGMNFTPDERELLVSVLTENMSKEEKAKVQLIRNLASRMQKN